MKRSLGILLLTMSFMTLLSSCEKKELLNHKTVYGEATINNKAYFQYTTIGEGVSNKYWFLPLGVDNHFIIKEGVCYLQLFLRDYEEKDAENFWLILIGCRADEHFPVVGKEYEIVVENRVDLGNIYNSFYWSGKLRDFYTGHPESGPCGIAGLSIPLSHERFIPLEGLMQFLKGDAESGEYSISYNFRSENNAETYRIVGQFNGKLKIVD